MIIPNAFREKEAHTGETIVGASLAALLIC